MLGTDSRALPETPELGDAGRVLGIIAIDDRGLVSSFSPGLSELGLEASPGRVGRHWTELLGSFRRIPTYPGSGDSDFVIMMESTRRAFRVTSEPFVDTNGGGSYLVLHDFEHGEAERPDSLRLTNLSELAAGVAHEINNPLTTISGWIQIFLADLDDDEPAHEQFRSIQEELDRIARIVDKLLNFAQRSTTASEIVDVNELLRGVVSFLEYQMLHANVRVLSDLSPAITAADANAGELKQVFLNLMLNARQAMAEGGVLRISTAPSHDGRMIEVRFTDTGHGIPEDVRDHIFNRHFTTRGDEGGNGLGLAVSREFARKMDGDLVLESTSPEGSTFLLRLPALDT
jgi:signal transduction histidine kinase